MAIQNINSGAFAGDGTGTPARTAGQMLNANFAYLLSLITGAGKVKISTYWVDKGVNTDVAAFEVGDTFDGWVSTTRYVVGRVIALPFNVDDATKVSLVIDNQI